MFPLWKRVLDIGITLVGLVLFLPLAVVVICWIKVVSKGPVFFRQTRIGFKAEPFTMLKFRTMEVECGEETDEHEAYLEHLIRDDCRLVKRDTMGDTRLIRGGYFLRAAGLDELPQLLNVLRGEMSAVGPRPCLPREYKAYREEEKERFNALPGLTGHWQVNGKNTTTFSEMIELDTYYARNMSWRLDLRIMLRTIPTIVRQVREQLKRGQRIARERGRSTAARIKASKLVTETTKMVAETTKLVTETSKLAGDRAPAFENYPRKH